MTKTEKPSQAACAYRLKDADATEHYGKDVYVYYSDNELTDAAFTAAVLRTLEPLYDQAALDAAVAAERERWETAVRLAVVPASRTIP